MPNYGKSICECGPAIERLIQRLPPNLHAVIPECHNLQSAGAAGGATVICVMGYTKFGTLCLRGARGQRGRPQKLVKEGQK